jgi:hypothetical protein
VLAFRGLPAHVKKESPCLDHVPVSVCDAVLWVRAIETARNPSVRIGRDVAQEEVEEWDGTLAVYRIQLVCPSVDTAPSWAPPLSLPPKRARPSVHRPSVPPCSLSLCL